MKNKNILFPGRPDYTGPTFGFFGLLHHDQLFEWSNDVNERIRHVKYEKPENEVGVRLYNMIYIDLDLPELHKAQSEYDKARSEYGKAWSEYGKAWPEYDKAQSGYTSVILAYIKKHIPDTAWDGNKKVMVFK